MTPRAARKTKGFDIKSYIPIVAWLPNYKRKWLRPDLLAALTVWALLVPEAMAYAGIAGLPPEAGLYAAPLALLGYAIFGTSRQLVVGPSSTVAALSFVVVGSLAETGSEAFITLSAALALLVGLLLVLTGLFKIGFIADFMSKPVLRGFVVGVALTIILGQLSKILGYVRPEYGDASLPDLDCRPGQPGLSVHHGATIAASALGADSGLSGYCDFGRSGF
jgi:MFS superfamily sulfate permease-like transporter